MSLDKRDFKIFLSLNLINALYGLESNDSI